MGPGQFGAFDVLEQKRGAFFLHHARGDFRDLQNRVDFRFDPVEVAFFFEKF
jgi:hypothetical protein